jgi:hypothetical protein
MKAGRFIFVISAERERCKDIISMNKSLVVLIKIE